MHSVIHTVSTYAQVPTAGTTNIYQHGIVQDAQRTGSYLEFNSVPDKRQTGFECPLRLDYLPIVFPYIVFPYIVFPQIVAETDAFAE